ncbi:unnamed protein product [Strongylus vulgaris]|uniref:Uncharacterized protein n=1 Tax=Strongylus vulgaris TaxID=40348 RepID=A0A3P7JAQ9_STRVU|nr:unnamed protein product [Strongylus vulgaris]
MDPSRNKTFSREATNQMGYVFVAVQLNFQLVMSNGYGPRGRCQRKFNTNIVDDANERQKRNNAGTSETGHLVSK